jgi:hypothetical protein
MSYRMYGVLAGSLGAVALMLAGNETVARSGGVQAGGFATMRPVPHSPFGRPLHRFTNHRGAFWPGGYYDGSSNGEPLADVPLPLSNDIHYTYTYDVPWDWAHRYPPNVTPSDRAYVSQCPAETVTVPGAGGKDHTVNIVRCN